MTDEREGATWIWTLGLCDGMLATAMFYQLAGLPDVGTWWFLGTVAAIAVFAYLSNQALGWITVESDGDE